MRPFFVIFQNVLLYFKFAHKLPQRFPNVSLITSITATVVADGTQARTQRKSKGQSQDFKKTDLKMGGHGRGSETGCPKIWTRGSPQCLDRRKTEKSKLG
ncbi:hypothetical protein TNIN_230621 [Trichonephila inaurata madagascariensis]|uniref:Uncharacterized protein n=1 Tax=Trichonephila inaurata madagascariensis TaxID=2747483 RepID=A0A8X6XYF1_9ARAC|nr:hypothetical protein TNIN_230621 [Trichonephila inaurata madagascariensis]